MFFKSHPSFDPHCTRNAFLQASPTLPDRRSCSRTLGEFTSAHAKCASAVAGLRVRSRTCGVFQQCTPGARLGLARRSSVCVSDFQHFSWQSLKTAVKREATVAQKVKKLHPRTAGSTFCRSLGISSSGINTNAQFFS